jgi:thioredoxin-like negative regulator of GroEL
MKVRTLLWMTAIVSSILGALIVYLVLSVPNDLRADALLKDARKEIAAGKSDDARNTLTNIVQQYPRTDAAAAATVALVSLANKEHEDLARSVSALRKQNDEQAKLITDLQKDVSEIRNAPPKVVTVTAPPPKTAPAKKKTAPKKPVRRRRR